ncbi:MAG: threonylcarbamoyl-AMP synthase [Betaproteobacteria bacterium]|nr:threonylcarbamoyl-AMP synthase [Betaproteobacteria bacterium]NBT10519.1 threonylcarbamoyl-AMP synthase [Betaproteobacteria bacterium]NBU49779.1 threonylcarbamoyl-AMP synthase [Betaproteobacteria bacterium]NBX96038.1 threonylcarbamoyl-AMP synthase [Betaproteobacteria bacterium]
MPFQAGREFTVESAARRLAGGALVAFPTETVYGLGARADDDSAVAQVFQAKGRPADHPLIVHVLDEQGARAFARELPPVALRLMRAFWPGPVTVIVPRRADMAQACAGGQDSIGLRCPAHPLARALLQRALELGVPGVAAPSANRFGRVSPTTAAHVWQEFGDAVPVLDGGPCEAGIESAIVDCTRGEPVLLRPGTVERLALERACGHALGEPDAAAPRAPGTLESHYAPVSKLRLMAPGDINAALVAAGVHRAAVRQGVDAGALARHRQALGLYSTSCPAGTEGLGLIWRAMPQTPQAVARELFAVLRELDAAVAQRGGGEIWVEAPPRGAQWEGVRDRLTRAAA